MRVLSSILVIGSVACAVAWAGSDAPHWGYKGHTGPQHWGELSQAFSTCSVGTRQSPIDIDKGKLVKANLSDIQFDYKPVQPEIINNGHTIQVNHGNDSSIKVAGVEYRLLQFHFHTPSENTVGGKPYDMEMHLVHKNSAGELAVVGVFLKAGAPNAELQKAWDALPTHVGEKRFLSNISIDITRLLPANRHYSHFKGSLTTPPCSEGVNWFVLQEPVEVSVEQVKKFAALIGGNARPVQALNDRFVLSN